VLDRDYMTVPVAEIKRVRPTLTTVGGRVVYRAE
jgi:predicted amidohydrolase YtcJ